MTSLKVSTEGGFRSTGVQVNKPTAAVDLTALIDKSESYYLLWCHREGQKSSEHNNQVDASLEQWIPFHH